jgi:ribosomal protein S27AE
MPRPLPQERWLAETAERFAALETWRQAHPKATWTEIEAAIEAQLAPLRAELLRDTAMASAATDLAGDRPRCPVCGERVQAAGTRLRRLRGEQDLPIDVARTYARCPKCGTGLFPPR